MLYYLLMIAPTARQLEILGYIKGYINEHKKSPTYDQIRVYFGFAYRSAVSDHLRYMQKKGLLYRKTYQHKQIVLAE